MERKKKSSLIVDDCPFVCEIYKDIVSSLNENSVSIDIAYNCEEASRFIKENIEKEIILDFVILDLKLIASNNKDFLSGEDIGTLIRKMFPSTKIIISTSCNDNYRIYNVFKSLNPEGFLVKNDVTSKELKTAIKTVINNEPYYSKTILKFLRKEVANTFLLDHMDRKILHELSMGSRMKDMPNYIPLSVASIEKRKHHLKKLFNVKEKGDRELIITAKERGYI